MNIFLGYFVWWYSRGLKNLLRYFKAFLVILFDFFSVPVLVFTFFKPWKRDYIPTQGLSLEEKFQVWIFNLIARFFGMIVKFFTFLVFVFFFLVVVVLEIAVFLAWLFFPLIIIFLIISAFKDLFE